jgi:hypothetical protein
LRVASPGGATASVDLNAGSIQLGNFTIPSTGGWQNWTNVTRTVTLNAGTYNLGVFAQTAGWNFNWIEIVSAGTGGLTCSVATGAVTCTPASLASGATAEVQMTLQAGATATGVQRVFLHVASATLVDPQPGNNDATGSMTVTALPVTPPATPAASSGGGGGAIDTLLALALGGIGLLTGWRRRGGLRRR